MRCGRQSIDVFEMLKHLLPRQECPAKDWSCWHLVNFHFHWRSIHQRLKLHAGRHCSSWDNWDVCLKIVQAAEFHLLRLFSVIFKSLSASEKTYHDSASETSGSRTARANGGGELLHLKNFSGGSCTAPNCITRGIKAPPTSSISERGTRAEALTSSASLETLLDTFEIVLVLASENREAEHEISLLIPRTVTVVKEKSAVKCVELKLINDN